MGYVRVLEKSKTIKILDKMDKSDLQAMLRFAYQNDMMSKPFIKVFKWWNIQNSLAYNEYNYNLTM